MKTTLILTAALALTLGLADGAAATCMYHEIVRVDPTPRDTGKPAVDEIYVSVGYYECHPPPPQDPQ